MEWLFVLVWMLSGLATYRRVGYMLERRCQSGHDFQFVCSACNCKNCGGNKGNHDRWRSLSPNCDNYEPNNIPHMRTMFALLPTLALWPLLMLGWAGHAASKRLGLESDFWKPAPEVLSKEERLARKAAKREEEMEALRSRVKELESWHKNYEAGRPVAGTPVLSLED